MEQADEYVKRVLKTLIYIEDHIEEELTLEQLAKVSCYSAFHFHRLFEAVVGENVHKYVRRIRLERAAGRLLHTRQAITDIALDSNYGTSSAFTRAFKQCMGESPRNYRTLYKEVNAMTKKLTDLPNIKADKIEKIADVHLLFARRTGNYAASSQDAWQAMFTFVYMNRLDKTKLRYFSISHDDPQITNDDRLRFDACIEAPAGILEKGEVSRQILKGGKYAVFTHSGSHHTIGETFDRIFLRWLPDSKESFDDARPVFCEHFNLEFVESDPSQLATKIYIPLA